VTFENNLNDLEQIWGGFGRDLGTVLESRSVGSKVRVSVTLITAMSCLSMCKGKEMGDGTRGQAPCPS
jgi:hypothetical protein